MSRSAHALPSAQEALPGRPTPILPDTAHYLSGRPLQPPFAEGTEHILFGMGCFWGAERLFWQQAGVWVTAVGYAGGHTPNPLYKEVCSGMTGHTEVVLVVFDPSQCSLQQLLKLFWENHDPTQGMRQGNDIGTQYRSAIYCSTAEQLKQAQQSREQFAKALSTQGHNAAISTEVQRYSAFYYAEDYHQQYLAKNPHGYCGLAGTGICMPPA